MVAYVTFFAQASAQDQLVRHDIMIYTIRKVYREGRVSVTITHILFLQIVIKYSLSNATSYPIFGHHAQIKFKNTNPKKETVQFWIRPLSRLALWECVYRMPRAYMEETELRGPVFAKEISSLCFVLVIVLMMK